MRKDFSVGTWQGRRAAQSGSRLAAQQVWPDVRYRNFGPEIQKSMFHLCKSLAQEKNLLGACLNFRATILRFHFLGLFFEISQ